MEIIRGTTPTLIFCFDTIRAENLATAILLIKQKNRTVIEKELNDGTVSDGQISFTLTQEETLRLSMDFSAQICLDWKTTGGVRGRSNIYDCTVRPAGKDEVI